MRKSTLEFAVAIALCAATVAPAEANAQTATEQLSWSTFTSTPNGTSLAAIDARASNDVWAVGLRSGGRCLFQTLTEHFNGSSWQVVPSPNVQDLGTVLNEVAVLAANDVWAVGSAGCSALRSQTVAEHWDGSTWTIVPTPTPGTFDELTAVAGVSPTDVWAVGSTLTGPIGATLVEHWDGASWSVEPSPSITPVDELVAVSAVSSTDAWAVGSGPSGDADTPIAIHWDGSSWQSVPIPTPRGVAGFLSDVFARAGDDVWAVGGYRPSGGVLRPLAVHWDGQSWRVTSVPVPGSFVALDAVSGAPGGGLWASGFLVDAVSSRAVVVRRTGSGWVVEDAPPSSDVFDLSVLPRMELWGVSGADILHGLSTPFGSGS